MKREKHKEKNEKVDFSKIASEFEGLVQEYGRDAAVQFIHALKRRLETGESVRETIEEIDQSHTGAHTYKQAFLPYFLSQGVCVRADDGSLYIDEEQIREKFYQRSIKSNNKLYKKLPSVSRLHAFLYTFAGESGSFSGKQDLEVQERPVTYAPKDKYQALSPEWIRSQDFLLDPFQYLTYSQSNNVLEESYPMTVDGVTTFEVAIACYIYHPKYGAGKRENGKLLVKGSDGEYQNITGLWFNQWPGMKMRIDGEPYVFSHRVSKILETYGKNLEQFGILRADDFITNRTSFEDGMIVNTRRTGEVAIDGIRYTLGSAFGNKKVKIVRFDEKHVVVFSQHEEGAYIPEAFLTLYDRTDERVTKSHHERGTNHSVGKRKIELILFNEMGVKQEGESDQDYQKKQTKLQNFEAWHRTLDGLKRRYDITSSDMDDTTRFRLREIAQMVDCVGFVENCSKHMGVKESIQFLVSIGDISGVAEKVVKIASSFPEGENYALHQIYDSAIARNEVRSELHNAIADGRITNTQARHALFELDHRLIDLIDSLELQLRIGGLEGGEVSSAVEELITHKANNLDSFASVFRSAFRGADTINIEQIRGVEIEQKRGSELREEKKKILALAEENWKEVPTMKPVVLRALKEVLNSNSEKTRWHLLKKGKEIIGCARFDELKEGELYMGSVNVDSRYRGGAFGHALLQEIISKRAVGHRIHAHVYPSSSIASSYVERYGFVITGVEEVPLPQGGSEQGFTILRDDRLEEGLQSRELTVEEIISVHESESEDQLFYVKRYDLSRPKSRAGMIRDIARTKENNEVVTRFVVDPAKQSLRYVVIEKRQGEGEQLFELAS